MVYESHTHAPNYGLHGKEQSEKILLPSNAIQYIAEEELIGSNLLNQKLTCKVILFLPLPKSWTRVTSFSDFSHAFFDFLILPLRLRGCPLKIEECKHLVKES